MVINSEIDDVLFSKDGTVGKTLVFNQNVNIVLLSSIAIIRKTKNLEIRIIADTLYKLLNL